MWNKVKLGEVLIRQFDDLKIDELAKYKRVTIKTKGQGVFLRDELFGNEIGTKNQYFINEGQFLLSKIDAMNGAFGIVPKICDKAIITGNFWTYNISNELIETQYLEFLIKAGVFTELSHKASEGTTNRKYLREPSFLAIEIPLPPLSEQLTIVAKLENATAKLKQIKQLRAESLKETEMIFDNFLANKYLKNESFLKIKLSNKEYLSINPSKSELSGFEDNTEVSFIPMSNVNPVKGIIESQNIRKLFEVKKGYTYFRNNDVIFAKITPCMENGNTAVAENLLNNIGFGSTEFIVFRVTEKLNSKYLYFLFRCRRFRDIAKENMTGTAGQQRISVSFFENFEIPIPPLEIQNQIVSEIENFNKKLDTIKQLQQQTEAEITAMEKSILNKYIQTN